MPLYTYTHTCGFSQRFFLHENKSSVLISCYRCTRQVTAHRVNDHKVTYGEADGIVGVLERETRPPEKGKPGET